MPCQVPQYILEEDAFRESGGLVNIVVCQPRRISALGLAERVSAERGERLGSTVGYSVRLDAKRSERTHLLFCTTGWEEVRECLARDSINHWMKEMVKQWLSVYEYDVHASE